MILESLSQFAYFSKLYKALAPYRKYLIKEANENGWPLTRHLVLYYPHDPIVRQITFNQYLLGASLLVAPTLTALCLMSRFIFQKRKVSHGVIFGQINHSQQVDKRFKFNHPFKVLLF